MMEAFGWAVIRTSRDCYVGDIQLEYLDRLDKEVEARDKELWSQLCAWLSSVDDPWLKWQFCEEINNVRGVLQFFTSRNHRSSSVWDLMKWIANNGTGSYGLVYVFDNEDHKGNTSYGRGSADYSNSFRVWRILNGELAEFDDPFLSPFVPLVNPSGYA